MRLSKQISKTAKKGSNLYEQKLRKTQHTLNE